jgi:predicted ATPase
MREVVTQSEVSGGRALVGEASAESGTPYGAFAQMVRKALDQQSKNGVELPDFVLDDVLVLAPDLRPYYPDIESNPKLDPESEQTRLLENMVAFCRAFSEQSPLLLVLDDAHWADSSSIAMFQHLARRTKDQPIMLLATYREVELRDARPFNEMLLELNRQRIGTRIKLARLNKEETHAMLEAIFNDEITPDFLEGVYRETDGNPFFIEEVCKALVESGQVFYTDEGWDRVGMDELEIPQGIQVAVESRLTKLPDEVQEALRMAAVLGREFDYEVLIEASDLDEDAIIDAIEMADSAQMVQEGREDTLYEFVHALVPQSIRENTHRLRLRKLHKRAAAAYEKVQPENYESLAYHYSEGGDDSKALHYYILSGERALANYANQDAENHFIAAQNLTDDNADQARLLAQLGKAQARLSRPLEAVETWQESIDLYLKLGNKDEAAELYALSGRAIWESGNTQGGLEVCRQGLAALEGAEDGPGMARLFSETARACYFNGVLDEIEQYTDRALELAEQFDLPAVKADSLITLATFKGSGSPEAIPMLEDAVRIAESSDLVREASRGLNNLGVLQGNEGNYSAAIENYRSAAELARRTGQVGQQVFYLNNVIWSQLLVGQIKQAEQSYSALELLQDQIPDPELGARIVRGSRGFHLYQKGEFDEATHLIDQSIREEKEANDLFSLQNSLNGKSFLLQIAGELQEAEELMMEAAELAEKLGEGEFQYLFASIAASLQGEIERAANHLERALSIIGDSQTTFWRQLNILRAEGHLSAAEKDWEAAWEKFEELDKLQRGMNNLGIIHWTTAEWAEAHLLRGQPDDIVRAKELFEQARSDSETMGATGWVELIDGKLAELQS